MAAIDKIYLNKGDYFKLKEWCSTQPALYDKYGKETHLIDWLHNYEDADFKDEDDVKPVMNNPYYIDAYIIRNCPIDGVQKELMVNYGYWSQERIKEYYENVKNWSDKDNCPYWAKLEDFVFNEDGTITLKGIETSDYELIKDGKLYNAPISGLTNTVLFGKHFKCIKHPFVYYNRAFKMRYWFVDVKLPEGLDYMWYHDETNTWDFAADFVISTWCSSSCVRYKTIKAIKRQIRRWKLPIGTIVRCTGRYVGDTYEFIVTK